MLSYIQGKIKNIETNSVILLTNSGIGYEVIINELTYSKIFNLEEIELFLYHNITENGQTLFGFIDFEEREFFKELIKISGVGGRVAQTILSLGLLRLKTAILEDDKKTIESIKGVGKKMTEKIILELSDKDIVKNFVIEKTISKGNEKKSSNLESSLRQEIISTLTIMGYNSKRIDEILSQMPENLKTAQEIIPYVIKNI